MDKRLENSILGETRRMLKVPISGRREEYPIYRIEFIAELPNGGAFVDVKIGEVYRLGEITGDEYLKLQTYRARYFGPRENYWIRFRRLFQLGPNRTPIKDERLFNFLDDELNDSRDLLLTHKTPRV